MRADSSFHNSYVDSPTKTTRWMPAIPSKVFFCFFLGRMAVLLIIVCYYCWRGSGRRPLLRTSKMVVADAPFFVIQFAIIFSLGRCTKLVTSCFSNDSFKHAISVRSLGSSTIEVLCTAFRTFFESVYKLTGISL